MKANEKIKEILDLFESDKERFGGYSAIKRLHESAPEDYIQKRVPWATLSDYADDMYYMLSNIKNIIE